MSRKDEHINLALKQYDTFKSNDFDKVSIIHNSLAAIDINEVDIKTSINNIELEVPFFINATTGGSVFSKEINEKLAEVAKACNLMIATGSLSSALKDKSTLDSYSIIRDVYEEGILIANFNPNASVSEISEASNKLNADMIEVHINSAQEIVMAEGDRKFSHWKSNIKDYAKNFDNLIVKEVGFGMSKETIELLKSFDVKAVDVSGKGGTNFVLIESSRNQNKMDYLADWGQSTVLSLLEARTVSDIEIIASGGIRHPLDIIKAFILGASAVGISGLVLNSIVSDGVDKTIEIVNDFIYELKLIMALVGAKNINELRAVDLVFDSSIINYLNQRNIKVG